MTYKSRTTAAATTTTTTNPEKMAVKPPAEIGTKGTIGSLIRQEIDYFNRLQLAQIADTGSTNSSSRLKLGSLIARKKKKGGGKLIPSMCSMVEVADSSTSRPNGISGSGYRNLKADVKKLQS